MVICGKYGMIILNQNNFKQGNNILPAQNINFELSKKELNDD